MDETRPPACELAGINPPTVQILQPNVFQVLVINDREQPAPSTVNIQGTMVVNQPADAGPRGGTAVHPVIGGSLKA